MYESCLGECFILYIHVMMIYAIYAFFHDDSEINKC